jgi:hypothetical protein
MTTTISTMTEAEPLAIQVAALGDQVRSLTISDEATFQMAATWLQRIKALRDRVATLFTPHVKRAFEAHRALVAERQRLEQPLVAAETALKRQLAEFTVAEERRRLAAARAETAAATDARTDQIWREVEALETAGYREEAAALATELVTSPLGLVLSPAPMKVQGLATRDVWKYEVTDPALVPREYWTIDHQKLGAVVRAVKGSVVIPGVRVWAERTIATTSR